MYAYSSTGAVVPVSTSATVSYDTANHAIATITPSLISGVAPGSTTATASINFVSTEPLAITVTQGPQSPEFSGLSMLGYEGGVATLQWPMAYDPQDGAVSVFDVFCSMGSTVDFGEATLYDDGDFEITPVVGAPLPPTLLYSTTLDSCQSAALRCGETYAFAVRARDSDGNTDPNTVVRVGSELCPNPSYARTVTYVDGGTGHWKYFSLDAPSDVYDLGAAALAGAGELTGPRMQSGGAIIGLGRDTSGGLAVMARDPVTRLIQPILQAISLDTGGRGVDTPGSAAAFGLVGSTKVAFTTSGSTTDSVDLWLTDLADPARPVRRLLADVERAVPTSDGKIAVVYLDNIYLVTTPNLALPPSTSNATKLMPLSFDDEHSGELVFGWSAGATNYVVSFGRPTLDDDPVTATLYEISSAARPVPTSTVTVTGLKATMTGTLVTGDAADFDGVLVLQRAVFADRHDLYAVDLDLPAPAAVQLSPATNYGRATIDTVQ